MGNIFQWYSFFHLGYVKRLVLHWSCSWFALFFILLSFQMPIVDSINILGLKSHQIMNRAFRNYYIDFYLFTGSDFRFFNSIMVKGQNNRGKGKRGRKTNKETLENLADVYETGNLIHIRKAIHGWEKQTQSDDEDLEEQEAKMDFILDPGSTRGRVSLFQQSVKTYWKMKCVLAKAMANMEVKEANSSMLFELHQIKQDMHNMMKTQLQINERIGHIERQLNSLEKKDLHGSTAMELIDGVSF